MLLVKTIIKNSAIAGTGLFADEDIPRGTKIWIFKEGVDLKISKKQLARRSTLVQSHTRTYAYFSKTTNKYVLPTDNARFMNHSFNPNVDVIFNEESDEDINIAARNIKKGEELTINYEKFDQEFSSYANTYW
jgi:hypothetical protein